MAPSAPAPAPAPAPPAFAPPAMSAASRARPQKAMICASRAPGLGAVDELQVFLRREQAAAARREDLRAERRRARDAQARAEPLLKFKLAPPPPPPPPPRAPRAKLAKAPPAKRATGSGVKAARNRGFAAVAAKVVGPTVTMHAAYPRIK